MKKSLPSEQKIKSAKQICQSVVWRFQVTDVQFYCETYIFTCRKSFQICPSSMMEVLLPRLVALKVLHLLLYRCCHKQNYFLHSSFQNFQEHQLSTHYQENTVKSMAKFFKRSSDFFLAGSKFLNFCYVHFISTQIHHRLTL